MREDPTLTGGTSPAGVLRQSHRRKASTQVFEAMMELVAVVLVPRQQDYHTRGGHSENDGENSNRSAQ